MTVHQEINRAQKKSNGKRDEVFHSEARESSSWRQKERNLTRWSRKTTVCKARRGQVGLLTSHHFIAEKHWYIPSSNQQRSSVTISSKRSSPTSDGENFSVRSANVLMRVLKGDISAHIHCISQTICCISTPLSEHIMFRISSICRGSNATLSVEMFRSYQRFVVPNELNLFGSSLKRYVKISKKWIASSDGSQLWMHEWQYLPATTNYFGVARLGTVRRE